MQLHRANLQGEWSRLRYQQNPMRNGASTIKEMTAVLPRDASSLYFRDEIGNVSTSVVRRLRDKTEVRLQPRFPLLGGWQVRTVHGLISNIASCRGILQATMVASQNQVTLGKHLRHAGICCTPNPFCFKPGTFLLVGQCGWRHVDSLDAPDVWAATCCGACCCWQPSITHLQ